MIPKEKADSLITQFVEIIGGNCEYTSSCTSPVCKWNDKTVCYKTIKQAKECAVVAIGQAESALIEYGHNTDELQNMDRTLNWYDQVENELK
jgi:hypothetical protein